MDEYLRLGTVFLQKTQNAMPMMVVGYLPVHPETGEMYDYLVVMYPQGWVSDNSLLMIDHGEVGEILYNGFYDEKTDELIGKIQAIEM